MPDARTEGRRRSTWLASGTSGILTAAVVFGVMSLGALSATEPAAAADSSAVTVTAADQDRSPDPAPFPELAVTVSQTRDLVAQGIQVSWTGGEASTVPSQQTGGRNFLQIFQCWGDTAVDPEHPELPVGPDRSTCQYGGNLTPGATRDAFRDSDESVDPEDADYTVIGDGFASPTYTSIPFRSATGETVASIVDGKKVDVDVNTNQFFTANTTNEIPWAGSGGDGSGSVKFEVQTAMQSTALGCGAAVPAADGSVTGAPCWLVIVPRGTSDSGSANITQSGLFWDAWQHRLAVRLDFTPIGNRCPIGAAERQVAGSELVGAAISSWQPALCNAESGAIFSALTGAESDAAFAANGKDTAPMALTSLPLDADVTDTLAYAPIALTGLSISFAVDREPKSDGSVPVEASQRAGLPFTELKLTPRLVAKLLTNSYLDSLPTLADRDHLSHLDGETRVYNPRTLNNDPEFLAINDPEWAHQSLVAPSLADLLVPQGRSDPATMLWTYVTSDPDAAAFLAGEPDTWGMTVNPWSSTDAKLNPSGVAFSLPRTDFPKADPVEQAASGSSGAVNLVTWRPYVTDLATSAYDTLRGDGLALGAWDPLAFTPKYGKAARALPGQQRVLGLTDTASAARYQIYTAALMNPAGTYVPATNDAMLAAAAAMTADPDQPQVYGFDPKSTAAAGATTAYPLTMPVYAAASPYMEDDEVRASYADFIRFAATDGQTPGAGFGQLPDGYAPLPQAWRDIAVVAAGVIEAGAVPAPTPTPGPTNSGGSPAVTPNTPSTAVAPGASAPVPPAAGNPSASGDVAAALAGATTPDDPETSALAAAVPASLLGGFAGALAVPFIGRMRRRI
ncbi:hypothetical protein [Agromyces allii]|uniref:hypothetical protein n=1 Tax=Agromyces allii TaxID=393607 RepID=UPI0012F8E042|nr:hypothetical protein [Agromyces allii]